MAMTEQEKDAYVQAKKQIEQWLGKPRSRGVAIGKGVRVAPPKKDELTPDDCEELTNKAIDLWSNEYGSKKWAETDGVPPARVFAARALATHRKEAKRRAQHAYAAMPEQAPDPTDAIHTLMESRKRAGLYDASWTMQAAPLDLREPTKEQELLGELGMLAQEWGTAFERGLLSRHGEAVFRLVLLAAHAPTEKTANAKTFFRDEHTKCNRVLHDAADRARLAMEGLILGPRSRKQSAQELVTRVGWRRCFPLDRAASRIVGGLCIWNPIADLLEIGPDDERCFEAVHEALCKSDGSDDIATAKAVLKALGYRGKLHETFDFIRHRKRRDSADGSNS